MTHFTVKPVLPRTQQVAASGVFTYAFGFAVIDPEDIAVYVGTVLVDDGYTVSGMRQSDGGTVTFAAQPDPGALITFIRVRPIQRMTDFAEGGEFRADVVNDQFDSVTMVEQQLKEELSRTIRIDPPINGVDMRLPVPMPPRRAIITNEAGNGVIYSVYDPDATVSYAKDSAESAQAAEDSAASAAASAASAGSVSERDWGPYVLVEGIQGYGPLPIQPPNAANVQLFVSGLGQSSSAWTLGDEHGIQRTIVLTAPVRDTPGPGELQSGLEIFGKVIGGLTENAIVAKGIKERHLDDRIIALDGRLVKPGPPNKQLWTDSSGIVIYADHEPSSEWTNVKDKRFGAVGIGSDDTAAVTAATASMSDSGGCLYFPPGRYGISGAGIFPKVGSVFGVRNASVIVALTPDQDVMTLREVYTHVEGLQFESSPGVTRQSAPATIKVTSGSVARIRLCQFRKQARSIWIAPSFGAKVDIESLEIYDSIPGVGACIQADAGFAIGINGVLISNLQNAMPSFGISISNAGDVEISNTQVLCCEYGLNVFVPSGKTVASLWSSMTFFDNCGRGASLIADGGAIVRVGFNRCWFSSSHTDHGFFASTANNGLIDGVALTDSEFYLNAANGCTIYDPGVRNVDLAICRAAANGQSGIAMGVTSNFPVHDWSVIGCKSRTSAGLVGNAAYGLFAIPGHTGARVSSNDFRGNGAGPWSGIPITPAVIGNLIA